MQRIEETNEEGEVTDEKRKKNEKIWEQQKVTEFFEMVDEENEQGKITTEQIVTENSSTRGKYDRAKDMQTAITRIHSPVQVSEIVTEGIHGHSTSPRMEICEENKSKQPAGKKHKFYKEKGESALQESTGTSTAE